MWCLLSGGPVFGFAALKPVLIKEKIYESVCDVSTSNTTIDTWSNFIMDPRSFGITTLLTADLHHDQTVAKCTQQDLKLNMMFTVAAMLTNVSALVIGSCLDHLGPKFCGLVGAFFLYVACLVFIFSKAISALLPWFDPYLVGYAAMALGGPFAFISSFQLSNAFPARSGTILALLTGAFDASSAIFLLYRMAFNASNESFTLDKFFKLYLVVPLFITAAQVLYMPTDSYKSGADPITAADPVGASSASTSANPPSSLPHETDALLSSEVRLSPPRRRDSIGDALKQPYDTEGEEFLVSHSGGIFGILHGYSARYQLHTPWFYLMCLFTSIQMLRLNYFVATVGTQYTYLLGSVKQGTMINRFFDVALPLGGIIAIPFVGVFLDYCSTVVVLTALLSVSVTLGVLGLAPSFYTGVLNICFFVAYRPFFYTTVSDFCAKVFGFDTFGTVYGTIICIAGAVNYFQSVLDRLTHSTFKMNPTPINSILVAVTFVIGTATILYVRLQAIEYVKKRASASA